MAPAAIAIQSLYISEKPGSISRLSLFCGLSFFLVETDYNSSALKKYLLEEHGLLIRDASNFRGLDTHYFRVNTLTEAKNRLLLEALESVDKVKLEPYE